MPVTSLTIPVELVPQFEEWGKMTANIFGQLRNSIGMKPLNVPKDQEWFWSKKWQAGEREVDKALKNGDYKDFPNAEKLIEDLNSHV